MERNTFVQTSEIGQILTKKFTTQNEPHTFTLYFFGCFESYFGKICWKLLFLVKKVSISERSSEWHWKFVFLKNFCYLQILRNIFIWWNNYFSSNQWNRTNINKNCLPPQAEPHTAKPYFTVVLNHIWGKFVITSLFSQKSDYRRKKLRITLKVSISQKYLIRANPEEYFYVMETTPFVQTSE